jgi:phosphate transport system permease protein
MAMEISSQGLEKAPSLSAWQGRQRLQLLKEWIIERIIFLNGMASILFVVLILLFLLRDTLPFFRTVSLRAFLTGREWYPLFDPPSFGLVPLLLGSLWVTAGAILIALPLGLAGAIYISEVAPPRLKEILKPGVELLAAVPSVVLGFIGLVVLAPWLQRVFQLPTGLCALAGSIMVAYMALPTLISIAEDALHTVPRDYRDAALSLGATRWETIRLVLVPAASRGLIAATMLGVGRAIGETMTVLMVTGNAIAIPRSPLDSVYTMTAAIAAEMGETVHYDVHYFALFAVGCVLFLFSLGINLTADLMLHRPRNPS